MVGQKIHVLGEEDIVLLFGLLGIDGTIIEDNETFLKVFESLTKESSIGMIIIFRALSDEIIDSILEFKMNNKNPFIFLIPDIFQSDIVYRDIIFNKIFESIEQIITSEM
ncbi:MAG: V-type ATP synthase subunit F [Candidatus Hermodarchaeota archaeon]